MEAKKLGLKYYFTGNPCLRGHICERLTVNGTCVECHFIRKSSKKYKDAAKKHAKSEKGAAALERARAKYHNSGKARETLRAYQRGERDKGYRKSKRKIPKYRLVDILRSRLTKALKGKFKSGSFVRDLGCTVQEAMTYWESLPSWNSEWTWADHGNLFHLDHVRALGFFDLTDREQFLVAAHYTNIQPLSIEEHEKKTVEDIRLMRQLRKTPYIKAH